MQKISQATKLILEMFKTQAVLTRRFDSALGGLGINEFTILYALSVSSEEKMRRVDLAGKIGLTASGMTRLLLPMEKIGLVKSGESENDARARYVMIAPGGKVKLDEAIERMELLLSELIPMEKKSKLKELAAFIAEIGARTHIN